MPALLPTFATPMPLGPLPRGARYSFNADSLLFANVLTLSDLLAHLPGVYVARGGLLGQPEVVLYGGRGALGLELYWDGMPYLPLGRDSVFLDPARVSLAPLERVDVIFLPAALRIYLVTARPRSTAPVTEVRVATGDLGIAGYRGALGKRWRSGAGLSLVADWNSLDGALRSSTSPFNSVDLWLKAEFVPNGKVGASYQVLSSTWDRSAEPNLVDRLKFRRQDGIFRFFLASRADGLGLRVQGSIASSATSRDTAVAQRTLYQEALEISHIWPRASAALATRLTHGRSPFQLEGRAAWTPRPWVTLAADGRHATYGVSRTGDRLHLSLGVELPYGLSAIGHVAWAHDVQAPALANDAPQETTDLSGALRWERPWVTLEVGSARRDSFAPAARPGAGGLKPIGGLGRTPPTNYLSAHVSLRPLPGVQLAGWYFDPVRGGGDFEPPYHARLSATFYSKFWRVFRSGIFALRGEVAVESWSVGLGGQDSTGGQLVLPGATFVETNVEMQIAGVTIFWIIRNNNAMRASYVPGLGYPKRVQQYGVRWVFTN